METNKGKNKQNEIVLEEINLDINTILSFTVNIDNLKIFISTLLKNQSLLSQRISQLEKRLNESNIEPKMNRKKYAKSISGIKFNLQKFQKNITKGKQSQDESKINKKEEASPTEKEEETDNKNLNQKGKKEEDSLLKNKLEKEKEIKNDKEDNVNEKNNNENNINEKDEKDEKEKLSNINEDININKEDEKLYSDKESNNKNKLDSKKEGNMNDDNNEDNEGNDNEENEENEEIEENEDNEDNEDINNKYNTKKEEIKEKKEYEDENINIIKKKRNEQEKENGNEFDMTNDDIFEMNNKIKNLQKKVKNLELLNKVNNFTSNIDDKGEDIQMIKLILKDLKEDNKHLKEENEEFKKQIENINVKVADINIYDLFKNCIMDDGSIDAAKALVVSLEHKIFKKIELMDERDKKMNANFLELKNNLQDIVNKNGVVDHIINDLRNKFKELGELVKNNNNENINMMNNIEKKMNTIYKELFNKYDEKSSNIESNIKKINDRILNLEKIKSENINLNNLNNNLELDEETRKFLSALNNRTNEIETKINSIIDSQELNPTKEDLAKLEKEISKKLNIKDFYDLKEKYNIQLAKANNLEECIERLQDICEKNNSELIFYTKKMENLTANVVSIRAQIESILNKEEKKILDLTKYLEKTSFKKYIKSTEAEKITIENNFEELRKLINDISNIIQKKSNAEDLKLFENIINNKIEELKLSNNKRFADKVDTNKSMKFLDTQIRHIIDVYIKRLEKNDSWLIAKKPLGGFSCASCESYLGELKNKDNYLPWNKYPQREKEQSYRVGNGFSRMLNMLNVDLKNSEKEYESDDEIRKITEEDRFKLRIKNSPNSHREVFKAINKNNISAILKNNNSTLSNKTNFLPKILTNKNEENSSYELNHNEIGIENTFGGSNGEENNNKEHQESNEPQPHIVKIIKKTKINHESFRNERPSTFNKK